MGYHGNREQSREALAKGDRIRLERAAVRQEIASGSTTVARVLEDVPECMENATLGYLFRGMHRWGLTRCNHWLSKVPLGLNSVNSNKIIGTLTERQRTLIVKKFEEDFGAKS